MQDITREQRGHSGQRFNNNKDTYRLRGTTWLAVKNAVTTEYKW